MCLGVPLFHLSRPPAAQSLFFYGRYKQATCGDNTQQQPSIWTPIRRYMWKAHEKQRGKSQLQAKAEYVAQCEELARQFDFALLPADLEVHADRFFTEFCGTPNHPYVGVIPAARARVEAEEAAVVQSAPNSALKAPQTPLASIAELAHSAASSPASPLSPASRRTNGASGSHATSPVRFSAPSSAQRSTSVRSPLSPAAASSPYSASSASSSSSSAATSPRPPPSALAAEVNDKNMLASKLLALQQANAEKMERLEREMAELSHVQGHGPMGSNGRTAAPPSSRFATPVTQRSRSAFVAGSSSATLPGVAIGASFLHPDPSSPFSTDWTPNGMALRTRGEGADGSAFPTPCTPYQPFLTPFSGAATTLGGMTGPRSQVKPVRMNGLGSASPARPAASTSPPPAAASSSSPAASSSSSSAVASAPAAGAAAGGISSTDLDSLLSSLDAAHRSQVASFQAAEATWATRVRDAEERAEHLRRQVEEAAADAPADQRPAPKGSTQVTVEWQRDSALQSLITTAQLAVPIGLAAYGMFRLWTEYERRVLRR